MTAEEKVKAKYPDAGEDFLLGNVWKTVKIQDRSDFLGSSWQDAAERLERDTK